MNTAATAERKGYMLSLPVVCDCGCKFDLTLGFREYCPQCGKGKPFRLQDAKLQRELDDIERKERRKNGR